QEQVDRIRAPLGKSAGHHAGVQVASASGSDLANGKSVAGQALGIVIGLDVACEDGYAPPCVEGRQGPFEQGSLARARRTDEVDTDGSVACKARAQAGSEAVIF